jgi:hypothetical protein
MARLLNTPFPYDQEARRLSRMIRRRGTQSIEDLLLALNHALLDQAVKDPEDKKFYQRMVKEVDKASRNFRCARLLRAPKVNN